MNLIKQLIEYVASNEFSILLFNIALVVLIASLIMVLVNMLLLICY